MAALFEATPSLARRAAWEDPPARWYDFQPAPSASRPWSDSPFPSAQTSHLYQVGPTSCLSHPSGMFPGAPANPEVLHLATPSGLDHSPHPRAHRDITFSTSMRNSGQPLRWESLHLDIEADDFAAPLPLSFGGLGSLVDSHSWADAGEFAGGSLGVDCDRDMMECDASLEPLSPSETSSLSRRNSSSTRHRMLSRSSSRSSTCTNSTSGNTASSGSSSDSEALCGVLRSKRAVVVDAMDGRPPWVVSPAVSLGSSLNPDKSMHGADGGSHGMGPSSSTFSDTVHGTSTAATAGHDVLMEQQSAWAIGWWFFWWQGQQDQQQQHHPELHDQQHQHETSEQQQQQQEIKPNAEI